MTYEILHGNNFDILPTLADNSIDAIVTDPPYELGFMGKKWDSSGIAYNVELWRECLRVLKPGGHLLSFGGTRTWHRIAVAIEDAGFEVRDSIAWMYGSGFPKSLDISKAVDKAAGVERERTSYTGGIASGSGNYGGGGRIHKGTKVGPESITPEAQQWEGWGTALKPAFEPVIVARKPLIGTVAANVLEHGTGGLNIDGSRIGTDDLKPYSPGVHRDSPSSFNDDGWKGKEQLKPAPSGRWPSNVILDEYTAELLDEQTSHLKGATFRTTHVDRGPFSTGVGELVPDAVYGDSGGASRFFYVAKASKRDRNEGLEELDPQRHSDRAKDDGVGGDNPRNRTNQARQNFHPTVKPTALMRYLVKLVTPPGGVVLDPFTGSGSTGKAAILEGFDFIGIEMTDEYLPIIEGRLKHAEKLAAEEKEKKDEALF
jgi:DNA modification methylase